MNRRTSPRRIPRTRAAARRPRKSSPAARPRRIFLLSPANPSGVRGKWLLDGQSQLALRLRDSGVPLGELFSFVSGLYFRGKMAYSGAFARPADKVPGAWVITSCLGLLPPDELITATQWRELCAVPVHAGEPRYLLPLERDARALARRIGKNCEVVLLGSIATQKYVKPLLEVFGRRLLFPAEFVGRGDMSRGGLMLRCARAGHELKYRPFAGLPESDRHGARPPKLSVVFGS